MRADREVSPIFARFGARIVLAAFGSSGKTQGGGGISSCCRKLLLPLGLPPALGYAIERSSAYRVIVPQSANLTAPPSLLGARRCILRVTVSEHSRLNLTLSRTAKRLRALHTNFVRSSRLFRSATAPNSNTLRYESNSTANTTRHARGQTKLFSL